MGIKYSFVDNAVYGPEDINEIAGCLTGSGIAPFVSKDTYNTSDLNSVTAELVASGIDLDGCRCVVENVGTEEMCVRISEGIIFFDSGVRLVIDSDGYEVLVEPNTEGFVFAHYSPSLQVADIVFNTELPTDGEYVLLASVTADGKISENRTFARSKVATMGRNTYCKMRFTTVPLILYEGEEVASSSSCTYIAAKLLEVNIYDYSYIHIGSSFEANNMGFFGIEDNKLYYRVHSDDCYKDGRLDYINNAVPAHIEIINGELCILLTGIRKKVERAHSATKYAVTLF